MRHPFNLVGSTRWNAAFAYLDPARGRASLEIVPDAIVDRVLVEGGRTAEGLADHVGIGMGWEPTADLRDDAAAFEAQHPLFMAGLTIKLDDLFFFPAVDPGYEISAAIFFMKPRSRGSVRLTASDPEAPLAIDHGFLADPCTSTFGPKRTVSSTRRERVRGDSRRRSRARTRSDGGRGGGTARRAARHLKRRRRSCRVRGA